MPSFSGLLVLTQCGHSSIHLDTSSLASMAVRQVLCFLVLLEAEQQRAPVHLHVPTPLNSSSIDH